MAVMEQNCSRCVRVHMYASVLRVVRHPLSRTRGTAWLILAREFERKSAYELKGRDCMPTSSGNKLRSSSGSDRASSGLC